MHHSSKQEAAMTSSSLRLVRFSREVSDAYGRRYQLSLNYNF